MNRRLLSFGLLPAVLGTGILCLSWTASARAPGSELVGPLDSLIRYSNIHSIHFIAHATIWLAPQGEQPQPVVRGTGEFEFWADADRYRVRCVTAPQLQLATDLEIAFDGERRQQFSPRMAMLIVKKGNDSSMPLALPNPLFLPLDFLNPETDACKVCAIRLTDLQDPRFWSRRTQTARKLDVPSSVAAPYAVDGALFQGAQLSYRVDFGTVQGRVVPLRVVRSSSGGSRVEISSSNFEVLTRRSGGPVVSTLTAKPSNDDGPAPIANRESSSREAEIGPIPLRVEMASYDTTGANVANIVFTIDVIDLSWDADPRVFTIDEKLATTVWDGDARVFTSTTIPRL